MAEVKNVFFALSKRDNMEQHMWAQVVQRITALLEAHATHQSVRLWVSASDSGKVSACWEGQIPTDQVACFQGLLGRLINLYNTNAVRWADAHITFVNAAQ